MPGDRVHVPCSCSLCTCVYIWCVRVRVCTRSMCSSDHSFRCVLVCTFGMCACACEHGVCSSGHSFILNYLLLFFV